MEKKPHFPIPRTDNTLKIVRSVRDVPPAHYILKIKSFSLLSQLLQQSGDDKYESNDFEAGGYKWRLLLYPDGDKKRHVNGHISLYLSMSDAKNLTLGSEVNVIFKFFVLDQIREKYLTLEDGRVRQFHALKTERGIPRLISLSVFGDPSNGYLIDDCCIFGVEVFVVQSQCKGQSLSIINEPDNATFSWTIDKFSGLKDECHYSEGFSFEGCQWKLMLYPNGDSKEKGKSLSLYLSLHDYSVLRAGWKMYVKFKLCIRDQVHEKHLEKIGDRWLCSSITGRGYPNLISLSDLNDENRGFLVNDRLIVEGKITFITVVNCFA